MRILAHVFNGTHNCFYTKSKRILLGMPPEVASPELWYKHVYQGTLDVEIELAFKSKLHQQALAEKQ